MFGYHEVNMKKMFAQYLYSQLFIWDKTNMHIQYSDSGCTNIYGDKNILTKYGISSWEFKG